jgi:hypothetical protein
MSTPREFRIDQLFEKHEYMGYEPGEAARVEVDVAGVRAVVLVPSYLPKVSILSATPQGDLLFLVGRIHAPPSWGIDGNGALLVARKGDDGIYAVRVWHEMYRYALEELGYGAEGIRG